MRQFGKLLRKARLRKIKEKKFEKFRNSK